MLKNFFENDRAPKSLASQVSTFVFRNRPDLKNHYFFPSSGSGGIAKWILLSEAALTASALSVNRWLESTAEDVFLLALPEFHVGGFMVEYRARKMGAKFVKLSGKWSAEEFVASVRRNLVTQTSLVPAQIYDLLQANHDAPESLRAIFVGGGKLNPVLYQKAREKGWPLLPTYGMTEAASQIATASLASLKDSAFPKLLVLPHWRVKEDENSFLGIAGQALATAVITVNGADCQLEEISSEGFYRCPDRVRLNKTDLGVALVFLGRSGSTIKIGGELCDLTRVESALDEILLSMQLCQKAVVVDVEDARLGSRIVLFVEKGLSEDTVQKILKQMSERLLPLEVPSASREISAIPRTDLQKAKLAELRKIYGSAAKS